MVEWAGRATFPKGSHCDALVDGEWQEAVVQSVKIVAKKRVYQVSLLPLDSDLQRETDTVRECGDEEDSLVEGDVPLNEQLHYWFDGFMVNSYASFVLVSIAAVITVFFGGLVLLAGGTSVDDPNNTAFENMWVAWKYLNDGAAHADEKIGTTNRFTALCISLLGILIMSILMGFVVDLISVQMEELRKGHSKVVEFQHTLILGWSEKIITILEELCAACETMADGSQGGCIVILNDSMEKCEMEAPDSSLYP